MNESHSKRSSCLLGRKSAGIDRQFICTLFAIAAMQGHLSLVLVLSSKRKSTSSCTKINTVHSRISRLKKNLNRRWSGVSNEYVFKCNRMYFTLLKFCLMTKGTHFPIRYFSKISTHWTYDVSMRRILLSNGLDQNFLKSVKTQKHVFQLSVQLFSPKILTFCFFEAFFNIMP